MKVANSIQEIIEKIEGVEACFLVDSNGEVIFQRVLNNSDNSLPLTLLLIKTIINNKLETYFSRIKFVTLEGANKKLILSYLPQNNSYISVIGTRTLMNGIIKLHLNQMTDNLES